MLEFFKRLKIRAKLLAAFGSIILLSVLLTVYAIVAIKDILKIKSLASEAESLSTNLVRLELASKEFIAEGYKEKYFQEFSKSEYIDAFNKSLAQANENLQLLSVSELLTDPELKKKIDEIANAKQLSEGFREMIELLKIRGFKDFGLEGQLRESIHSVEKSDHDFDKALMLTLRRHEKDFFLRKELKYQNEFNTSAKEFEETLVNRNDTILARLLLNYQNRFNEVVEIEKQIGLSSKEGKKGNYFNTLEKIKEDVELIQKSVAVQSENQIANSRFLLIIIFIIQLILATILSISYANVITAVIKELRSAMATLADGKFPAPLLVRTKEEIGQTKTAFNQMLDRIKVASKFAENLGNGQLHQQYDEAYKNDVLAKSIIAMQQKLNETEKVQAKINWTNESAAQFNEIIKNENVEVTMLSDTILRQLINFLKANQGAMYLVDENDNSLDRIATYAYGKKKFINEKLSIEDGLLGQCYQEKESIYLKEVPKDFIKITSGLGEAPPNNILITPLKTREKVVGLIELASFNVFEKHEIEFVQKMSESIASILVSRQIADHTKRLLEEARQREQELAQREEEMRQNAEELLATQEEMQRQRTELEREIKSLKSKLSLHEISLN
jgi:GAF domain-containing protein/HAMP domain-containing protein